MALLGVCLLSTNSVFGQIIINEFQIEPEQSVELWNSSNESVDLGNWVLDDSGGTTFYTIPTHTMILPLSCLVFTANFNLNRTSPDQVRLFDPQQTQVDNRIYDLSPGANQSWQRIPNATDNWKNGESTLFKNNTTGESCLTFPTPSPTLTPFTTPALSNDPTPLPTPTPPSGIYLNEALVNPESGPEWVEIYNHNDFEVKLENWYLDDEANLGGTPKQFSLTLNPKELKVVELVTAVFNNDHDSVRLLDQQKQEIDSFEYENSQKGESYSRQTVTESVWCKTAPSRDKPNNSCYESPSQIVLGAATTPLPVMTKTSATNSQSPTDKPPGDFAFKAIFHALERDRPNVLGIKTISHKNKRIRFQKAVRVSQFWFLINLGLNLCLVVYILYYYHDQKIQNVSPV